MNSAQQALWQRLENHALDDPASTYPFSVRLAEENGWSLGFTRRAVEEYRRFAFLAAAAGHPVSPPDAVDQVWHLHLLYTHDYWDRFCPVTLGQPLHHGPTRGGAGESVKFADWYAHTLVSYRTFFGAPPADLWPAQPKHPRTVRVDPVRHWIVPRPDFRFGRLNPLRLLRGRVRSPALAGASRASLTVAMVAATLLLPTNGWGAEAATWPFTLRGPDFLVFYSCFALGVFVFTAWLRRFSAPAGLPAGELDAYEAAQLAGGEDRVFAAALATLAQKGLVRLEGGKVWRSATPATKDLPLVESVILAAASPQGAEPGAVRKEVKATLQANQNTLRANGLMEESPRTSLPWLAAMALEATVVVVGVVRIWNGWMHMRPVGYLVGLTLLAGAVFLYRLARKPGLTSRGKATLKAMRTRYADQATMDERALASPTGASLLPMAVGLFGLGALAQAGQAIPREELQRMFIPPTSGGDSGGWSTSDGGSSSGDSGSSSGDSGGGDGGGGGGCGGCGGGGD